MPLYLRDILSLSKLNTRFYHTKLRFAFLNLLLFWKQNSFNTGNRLNVIEFERAVAGKLWWLLVLLNLLTDWTRSRKNKMNESSRMSAIERESSNSTQLFSVKLVELEEKGIKRKRRLNVFTWPNQQLCHFKEVVAFSLTMLLAHSMISLNTREWSICWRAICCTSVSQTYQLKFYLCQWLKLNHDKNVTFTRQQVSR